MADFTFTPHKVQPGVPVYNNILTKMEGMRKKGRNKSSEPDIDFTLTFDGQTDAEMKAIFSHYDGQYGGDGDPFYWTTVPDYIDSGTNIYSRYKSIEREHIFNNCWVVTVVLQKEIIP